MDKQTVLKLADKKEDYNTTNGWGFNGAIGIRYYFGDYILSIGEQFYRHAPSSRFTSFRKNGKFILDKTRFTKKDWENIYKIITE